MNTGVEGGETAIKLARWAGTSSIPAANVYRADCEGLGRSAQQMGSVAQTQQHAAAQPVLMNKARRMRNALL